MLMNSEKGMKHPVSIHNERKSSYNGERLGASGYEKRMKGIITEEDDGGGCSVAFLGILLVTLAFLGAIFTAGYEDRPNKPK